MAGINPLQLPKWETTPQIDWSPLNRIGDAIGQYRRKEMMAQAVADATGPDGRVDLDKLGASYLSGGEVDAGMAAARLADARAQREQARANDARDFAFRREQADRSYALDRERLGREPDAIRTMRALGVDPASPEARALAFPRASTIESEVEQRRRAATAQGLDPNSPQAQAYVLTGKMPREDQQPLSATDKKYIMEADEGVLAANTAIDNLRQAKDLSKRAYEGPLAGQRGYAASLVGAQGGQDTTELNNLVMSNALSQLKAIFGAAPTEGERKILLDIQGSVNQPDAVRQRIYDRAIALATVRLEFNRRNAEALRGGTFYRAPGAPGPQRQGAAPTAPPAASAAPAQPAATFDERFTGGPPRAEVRPSEKVWGDREAESAGIYEPRPQTAGRPVQVRTADEARRLPRGTRFIDPNGVERIVP